MWGAKMTDSAHILYLGLDENAKHVELKAGLTILPTDDGSSNQQLTNRFREQIMRIVIAGQVTPSLGID
jgi:hypothetical protein